MHPTKLIRAWAAAGLLAGLAALSSGPAAQAQPKADPPMATPDRTGAISVTIGGQVRFQMKTKKRIREAFNENDRVVQVLADATDPTTLILIGRAAGTSRLEVTDVDGAKESYLIVVQRDVEMLRNLIRRTVPTALVEITPIGDSGTSIILSGYVANEGDRDTIRQLAEALGLRVAVNTVTVGGGGHVPHVQLDVTLAKVDRTRARSRGANFIINGNTVSAGSLLGGLDHPGDGGGGRGLDRAGRGPGPRPGPARSGAAPGSAAEHHRRVRPEPDPAPAGRPQERGAGQAGGRPDPGGPEWGRGRDAGRRSSPGHQCRRRDQRPRRDLPAGRDRAAVPAGRVRERQDPPDRFAPRVRR